MLSLIILVIIKIYLLKGVMAHVCICKAVTEEQIRSSVNNGAKSLPDLAKDLSVTSCCGLYKEHAKTILNETNFEDCSSTV